MNYFIILTFIHFSFGLFTKSNVQCENAYCAYCDETKKCSGCIDNYLLVDGDCKYMRNEHCNKVHSLNSSICMECLHGYKLNTQTMRCEEGREICREFEYDNNQLICNYKGFKCLENEVETNKGCIDCSTNKYCVELEEEASDCSNCIKCAAGTKLVNGKCENDDIYCKTFDKNGTCTKCAAKHKIGENGKCVKGNIENCIFYNEDGTCSQCKLNGVVKDGKCTDICDVENCLVCKPEEPGKCLLCKDGFGTNSAGKCLTLPDNCKTLKEIEGEIKCRKCKTGYFVDTDNNCRQFLPHCETRLVGTNDCASCEKGYYLTSNDTCEKCTNGQTCKSCQDEFIFKYNESCYTPIRGCWAFNADGTCRNCFKEYTLTNGKCELSDPCASKEGDKCILCLDGYYMTKDYKCEKCDDQCKEGCAYSSTSCIHSLKSCAQTPDEKLTVCTFTYLQNLEDDVCFQFNSNGECISCNYDSYQLIDGKCKKIVEEEIVTETIKCDSTTFDGECLLCVDEKSYKYYDPYENGECIESGNDNGTIETTLLLFFVVLMLLF